MTRAREPMIRFFLLLTLLSWAIPLTLSAQENRLLSEVRTLDEEHKGVISEVFRMLGTGDEEWLASTDEHGTAEFEPPVLCSFNHRIIVRPDAPLRYEQPKYQPCRERLVFVIRRWGDIAEAVKWFRDARLIKDITFQTEALREGRDFGSLALLYTELASRLRRLDRDLADQLSEQAYIYAGKALKVGTPLAFVQKRGKSVMSRDLNAAVITFQRERNIDASGQLDSKTLQALAGKAYWQLMYKKAPPVGGPGSEVHPLEIKEAKETAANLAANARAAVARDEPALAALLYTEVVQRLILAEDLTGAKEAEKETYVNAAKALSVQQSVAYDPLQEKWVMDKELTQAVKKFQRRKRLPASGVLDYRTLHALSGKNVGPYLYRAPEE